MLNCFSAAAAAAPPGCARAPRVRDVLTAHADDARWAAYLADNWPSLAEKKAAVRAAGASEESVRAFNEELAEVMRRTQKRCGPRLNKKQVWCGQ